MTHQENALTENLNKDLGPNDGLAYLNSSDILVEDSKPLSQTSYWPLLVFFVSTIIMNVLAKALMLYSDITPFEIVYAQGVISVIASMIYLKTNDIYLFSVETNKSSIVLAGSLAGFIAVAGFYMSLYHLNIVDAFALDYLSVVSALMVDYVLFKGSLRFYQLLGLIGAVLGLIVLVRPGLLLSESEDSSKLIFSIGIASGIVGAIFSGIYGGMLRRLYSKVHLLVLLTFMQFAMALFSPCFVLIHFEIRNKPTTYGFWSLIGLVAVGGINWISHWSLATTLKEEKIVSRIYPFKYVLIFIGILVDIIAFHMGISLSSIIGTLIIGSNFAVGIYYMFFAFN